MRPIQTSLLLIFCMTTGIFAGISDNAELSLYLRGNPEDAWVRIETVDSTMIKEVYRPRVLIFRNLRPGKAKLTIENKRGISFDVALKASMRTIVACDWAGGKFHVNPTRWLPTVDSRYAVTNEMLSALPFDRKATAPLSILPGVVGDDLFNIHGATQRANRYLVDGVDASDPFDGTFELRLPFAALDQLALRHDDFGSEGSTVALSTTPIHMFDGKFGGEGSLFYKTSDFPDEIEGLSFTRERRLYDAETLFGWGTADGDTRLLGTVRYLSDDFREQPDRFKPIETRVPAALLRFEKRFGKAWLLNAGWYSSSSDKGSFFSPRTGEVDIREKDADLVTADERHNVLLLHASLAFSGSRTSAAASFSYYRGSLTREPASGNRAASTLYDEIAKPAVLAGGSILNESRDDMRERLRIGLTVDRELHLLGEHRLSGTASGEWSDMRIERAYNGGFIYDFSETLGRAYRRVSFSQDGNNSILDQRSIHRYQFALNDHWNSGRFSLDIGLTFDKTSGGNDIADVFDWSSLEPHIQAKFDLFGDGEVILHGGYHRSYYRLLGSQIPGNPYIENTQFYDIANESWDTSSLNRTKQFGFTSDGVDADIDRPYADVFSLGTDILLGPRSSLTGTWTWRRERDLFEDIETNLWPNYTTEEFEDELDRKFKYFVRNPGLDETLRQRFFLTTLEDLEREYYGFDLMFSFEPDQRTSFWAAYTWSRTNGNIDNSLEESRGDSRVYNDPNERINADGFLSSDNRHLLRLAFAWLAPQGIKVGGLLRFDSGSPLNRLRLNPDNGRYEIFGDPRGSIYRADATTTIDLRISRQIRFGNRFKGTALFDLFNLTDDETPTAYFLEDDSFGLPLARREPRRWRLGFQLRF